MPEEVGHRLNWCRLCKTCLTCPRQPRYIFNTKACKCKEYELKHSARLVKKMHSTDFRFRHLNKEERSAMRFLRKDMGRKVPEIEDSLVRANICGTCQQRLARGVKAERELADEVDKDAAVDFRRHRSTAENIRRRKNKRMKSTSTDESAGAESNVVQDTSDESRASTNPVSEAEIAATALAEIRRTVTPTNQASPLIEQPDSRRCSGNLSLNHRPHSFEGHAYSRDSAPPTVGLAVTSAGTGCAQENSVAGYHRRNRISVDCIINNGDDGAHDGADFSYFQSNAPGSTVIVHGRDILPYKWTGHVEDTHMAESLPTDKRPASEYPPLLLAESAPYPILRLHVYDYAEVKLFSETVLGSITLNELFFRYFPSAPQGIVFRNQISGMLICRYEPIANTARRGDNVYITAQLPRRMNCDSHSPYWNSEHEADYHRRDEFQAPHQSAPVSANADRTHYPTAGHRHYSRHGGHAHLANFSVHSTSALYYRATDDHHSNTSAENEMDISSQPIPRAVSNYGSIPQNAAVPKQAINHSGFGLPHISELLAPNCPSITARRPANNYR